mgnify:CR=1
MFHQHAWQLIAKTAARSSPTNPEGSTSLLFQCSECPKQSVRVLAGLDDDALDSITGWVDTYGHKYIERSGRMYLIVRVRDEEKDAVTARLPLKTAPTA